MIFVLILSLSAILVACAFSSGSNETQEKEYVLDYSTIYAMAEEANYTGTLEDLIAMFKGENGLNGNGIVKIEKTDSVDLVDTYTIFYSDNTTATFQVKNGKDGVDGKDGVTPTVEINADGYWVINGEVTNVKARGKSIVNESYLDIYPLDDGTFGVAMGRTKYLTNVKIPSTFNNKAISTILPSAFANAPKLKTIVIPVGVISIEEDAFAGVALEKVFYEGSAIEWQDIDILSGNESLSNATVYYYSETEPTVNGNWWRYAEGEPAVWENNNEGNGVNSAFSVHFLELGNYYAGDSVLLDCGDVEVLIDAGSRAGSAATLKTYIDQYCDDGILEYVIVTHAHQDHIAGFVGTSAAPGIFSVYECQTIIDFAKTNATSVVYKNYVAARDAEVEAGAVHYTAAQCVSGENGAQRVYTLGEGVTMTILDSYYYYNSSSDENNYSVCVLIENGDQHYLFTGDLESDGEARLVQMNDLPHCELFKGGHHGSYTASTSTLLQAITPDVICICCCVGSPEYTSNYNNMFPALAALERMIVYTERIYATSLYTGDYESTNTFTSFNGNIVVSFDENGATVNCSGSDIPVPYSAWCKQYRPTIYKGD